MAKTLFYNPKVAAMGIDVSVVTNSIQFEIAKSINPQAGGKPQAGSKVYDWDAKAFFSLTPDECATIDSNLNQILDGTYKDPRASDPKYAHILTLTHFRDNQPSRCSIQRAQDGSGNPINSVTVSITPPGGNSFFYPLRPEELLIWRWFIRNGYQQLPFGSAFVDALEKKKRKDNWDKQNKDGGHQSGGYQKSTPPTPPPVDSGPTFDSQDPGPTPPTEQQTGEQPQTGAGDIDFNF